jgi:hypothetical protein
VTCFGHALGEVVLLIPDIGMEVVDDVSDPKCHFRYTHTDEILGTSFTLMP